MAFNREDLLNTSIQEFKDLKENAILYHTQRLLLPNGYEFILKDETGEKISAAIHFDKHFEFKEIGKIEVSTIFIDTKKKIAITDILEYQNNYYAIIKQDNYNARMNIYHYIGQTCYGYNSNFIILDKLNVLNNLCLNSFEKLYNILANLNIENLKLNIYPTFLKLENINKYFNVNKFIVIEILDTKNLSLLKKDYSTNEYILNNNDRVKIRFINFNIDEVYTITGKLKEKLNNNDGIGLISNIDIYQGEEYETAFNLKSLLNISEFNVNYNIKAGLKYNENDKFIKSILYQAFIVKN